MHSSIEHLLCARYCSRSSGPIWNKTDQDLEVGAKGRKGSRWGCKLAKTPTQLCDFADHEEDRAKVRE